MPSSIVNRTRKRRRLPAMVAKDSQDMSPTSDPRRKFPMTTPASAPTIDIYDIAARLWETADELRANSHLKAAEYSIPVLGLIFLKFADSRFTTLEGELKGKSTGRREIGKTDYQARGVLYLPGQARFNQLLLLKESENSGKAINEAMAAIEEQNSQLKGVLPRTY